MTLVEGKYGSRYKINDSKTMKDKVFQKIIDYIRKFDVICGESLLQMDDPQLEAPETLADIIDLIKPELIED